MSMKTHNEVTTFSFPIWAASKHHHLEERHSGLGLLPVAMYRTPYLLPKGPPKYAPDVGWGTRNKLLAVEAPELKRSVHFFFFFTSKFGCRDLEILNCNSIPPAFS